MFDYLVDHALKNAWCTPDQDMQAIVKPARLTKPTGAFSVFQVLWNQIQLPIRNVRMHVYQIGQLHPLLMGLFPSYKKWTSLAEACNAQNLICDLYNIDGIELPRCEAWYMVTEDRNLILAVRAPDRAPVDLSTQDIYLRIYSNAFFNSVRANSATDVVYVSGIRAVTQNDILALQTAFEQYASKPGHTYCFVNGYKVDRINLLTVKVGDVAEFVYDGSIKKVLEFRIGDLPSFVSELDSKHKYLLHNAQGDVQTIDYHDDIDLFISRRTSPTQSKGIYYHRNQTDAVRMVTHCDYAIPVAYVAAYVQTQPLWSDMDSLTLTLHIRESGYERPLIYENQRIHELYKLPDQDILAAMLGLHSVVDVWRAAALEKSHYPELMSAKARDVTPALVQNAYGYNAISKVLCDTPRKTRLYSGRKVTSVPYGLQQKATAYEYDVDGVMIGYHGHSLGSTYVARDIRTDLVEMVTGEGYDKLDEVYGEVDVPLDPNQNYRMYLCPIEGGRPTNIWEDVTDSGKYAIENNRCKWLIDRTRWYPLVRGDKTFLAYDLQLQMTSGLLMFSLRHRQTRNAITSNYTMQIPMGELDIFLNGHSLIEGVDYVVKFPQIVITNKKFLVNPKTDKQKIHVRFMGFCNPDLSRDVPDDVGFIDYQLLSHNSRFDLRDDKVLRIVVDGALFARDELLFAEEHSGVMVPNSVNGTPYMVRDIVTPLRGLTQESTYSLRAKSLEIDRKISDYMTLRLPQPKQDTPSVIAQLYQLVSPFACKILHDLEDGVLNDPRLKQHYNDMVVMELCQPYLYLLDYDPSQDDTRVDPNYSVVHCHHLDEVMEISVYTYKFLTMVNRIYLKNRVEFSHIVKLKPIA